MASVVASYCLEISPVRAISSGLWVMAPLVASGIDKARLSAIGHGDAKPVVDNKDESGRAKNRRVELVEMQSAP